MTAGNLLDQIRDHYLEKFATGAAEAGARYDETILEPAVRDEDGVVAGEGPLDLPMRIDAVFVKDGELQQSTHFETETMLSFEPMPIEWPGGLEVCLGPFRWEACEIQAECVNAPASWSPLKAWFLKWFDAEDTHEPDENGFSGVVHFLSDPVVDGKRLSVSVDFGSGPVEAFEELLDALRNLGAATVNIGSQADPDHEISA